MSKYLVIVESPTKAKTIHAILGDDYDVIPSMGHVIDLPASKLSIDVENGFAPDYHVIKGKEKIIAQLKKKAKELKTIYIATDPDREGEAIGWHIQQKLSQEKGEKTFYRVEFHEITEDALREAFKKPEQININKVNSQVARRVLDRIVGYFLSPLLWKKIVRGLSAGRVQSVALKFIVDREREIKSFIPSITYSITAKLSNNGQIFEAELANYRGKKAVFPSREEAQQCVEAIKNGNFTVSDVAKKETKRKPPSPYTTSLLQQDGFTNLHFPSQKTMLLAQKLYEGVEVGGTQTGLITYMRTDSFQISPKAKHEIKEFITGQYGNNYLPEQEHRYKEKKGAQFAHEAIRPTSIHRDPSTVEQYLEEDGLRLYRLIWKRTLASFMKEALYENTKALISSPLAEFEATGRRLIFDGFLKIMEKEEEEIALPSLNSGENIKVENMEIVEHTTKPPAHFNDASLVKIMEEKGIGRPSTYAPTIATLIRRNYIRREKGYFAPTELGMKVNDFIFEHFPAITNEDFTASMEEKLDEVEEGSIAWQKILEDFYPAFKAKVEEVTTVAKKDVVYHDKNCPQCGSPMVIKWSRRGKFLSCATFPKCKYAESILTDTACPLCKEGRLIERRNKRGQAFYGCSKFPACRYTSRNLPVPPAQGETPPGAADAPPPEASTPPASETAPEKTNG